MPASDKNEIRFLSPQPPEFTQQQAEKVVLDLFGLTGEMKALDSERDQNFRIQAAEGDFVLKISNADEDVSTIDLQTKALLHLAKNDPNLPVPEVVLNKKGKDHDFIIADDGKQYLVRALTYLPGEVMAELSVSDGLYQDVGAVMAKSGIALRDFFHPAAGYDLIWDLRQLPKIRPFTQYLEDTALREMVEQDLDFTCEHILPQLSGLRSQVIHNDGNIHNFIVDPNNPDKVSGLVDFGDMMHAPLIFDLAVSAGSMTLDSTDPLAVMCAVAVGYDRVLPLEEKEIDLLSYLAVGRIIQELLIAVKRQHDDPNTIQYLLADEASFSRIISDLLDVGHQSMRTRLRESCQFPSADSGKVNLPNAPCDDMSGLIKRREQALGKTLELAYDKPFHVVRGEGVWLYDADGNRHLDVYNNVPQVGHCHPHVVKAVSRQLATLNTNTRYLFDNVVSYAERLAASLPGDLGSCIFVNSGSEATDAAMRIARTLTKKQGAIVIEEAYHGISESIDELSPSAYLGAQPPKLGARVRTLEAPDMYRGRFSDDPENAARLYAQSADIAIESLQQSGLGTAAFMIDSSFSSSGIFSILPGYLPAVTDKVRAAGGLIIADEVQIGFGRSGSHFWGFEAQGIMPDIVTLGKPVANGISLGVVVTTPAIREAFGEEIDFFSTFGGNPVACAAAHAVFDVIEQEGLLDNARDNGDYMRKGFRQLCAQYPAIGDVRGQGLFIGVEIVTDPISKQPDAVMANRIRNRLREKRVLVGSETRAGNVIKIRPPLAFRREHTDILLEAFAETLAELCH